MPDIKIVTEVAGRVCALPIEVGASVGDGDDIAFVDGIPHTATGKILKTALREQFKAYSFPGAA